MSGTEPLSAYLHRRQVPFEVRPHRVAYTAREVAAIERVPGKQVAKVVMVVADGKLAMIVVPATYRVDLRAVASLLDAEEVRLAKEREFARTLDGCEVGAIPPFGNRYGLPVYVDPALAGQETIIVSAGTHSETLSLRYADYARLVKPQVARVAYFYDDAA